MKQRFVIAVAALSAGALLSATPGLAAPVQWRADNLHRRIDQGVASGALTRREADRLHRELRQTERVEYRYRRDGLSRWERNDLQRRYDRVSRQVRWQKHDRQTRY